MPDYQLNPTPLRHRTPSLARRLITEFVKIGLALNRHDRKMAGSNGLGLTQTRILEFLRQCPKRSARLSAIAGGLSITPATACESLRTLTQKGLVRKVRSETDERVVVITLSAKGHRKADHAAGHDGFLIPAAESLTTAEQEALLKTLLKLTLVIQELRRPDHASRDDTSDDRSIPTRNDRPTARSLTRCSAITSSKSTGRSINRPSQEADNGCGHRAEVQGIETLPSTLVSTERGHL